jgi:hypothetical protein
MNPELQKSIAELINTLTNGAKGTGEIMKNIAPEAWRVAVRQVIIDGCTDLLVGGVIGIAIILLAILVIGKGVESAKETVKQCQDHSLDNYKEALVFWRIGYWVCTIIGSIVILCSVSAAAPKLLNPEYEAGMNVIRLAHGYR